MPIHLATNSNLLQQKCNDVFKTCTQYKRLNLKKEGKLGRMSLEIVFHPMNSDQFIIKPIRKHRVSWINTRNNTPNYTALFCKSWAKNRLMSNRDKIIRKCQEVKPPSPDLFKFSLQTVHQGILSSHFTEVLSKLIEIARKVS